MLKRSAQESSQKTHGPRWKMKYQILKKTLRKTRPRKLMQHPTALSVRPAPHKVEMTKQSIASRRKYISLKLLPLSRGLQDMPAQMKKKFQVPRQLVAVHLLIS